MRPAPISNGSAAVILSSFTKPSYAVSISADLISAGVQSGCSAVRSAAEPASCGLAIEVPPYRASSVSPSGSITPSATAARISTPGAAISGFSTSKVVLGPRELKSAIISAKASFSAYPAMLTVSSVSLATQAASASPTVPGMFSITPGILVPETLIAPGGLAFVKINTPEAPAASAAIIFSEKLQVPRLMRAIAPS